MTRSPLSVAPRLRSQGYWYHRHIFRAEKQDRAQLFQAQAAPDLPQMLTLVANGFKGLQADDPCGWRCYIVYIESYWDTLLATFILISRRLDMISPLRNGLMSTLLSKWLSSAQTTKLQQEGGGGCHGTEKERWGGGQKKDVHNSVEIKLPRTA